jgi:phage terminase large subunit-like protein
MNLTLDNPHIRAAHACIQEGLRRKAAHCSVFDDLYPSEGQYSRKHYAKHLEFFAAGARQTERAVLGGNRVGKTLMGAYETTCHLTGRYPPWWAGKRFKTPTSGWAAGDTSKTVKEIMQRKLLGAPEQPTAGMIPKDLIIKTQNKAGVPDAIETIQVRHASGGISVLTLKSYDQKRISFQGTAQHFIWLDEEVDEGIYTECTMRTMKTTGFDGGIVYLTFTPLMGLSEVVQMFVPDGETVSPDRFVIFISWDDIPHLDAKEKEDRARKIPAFQREARTKGIPQLGAGAIYPVEESEILIRPFDIPKHWLRGYGMDVGWNVTAAIFAAYDQETSTMYLTSEYYKGECEPSIHAAEIRQRGAGFPGFIDPAARGRSQVDGEQLLNNYRNLGLNLTLAENAVESGIFNIWDAMVNGKFKVFTHLESWKAERRLYRRDTKGKVVKEKDHLMDASRYLYSRRANMRQLIGSQTTTPKRPDWQRTTNSPNAWMA